MKACSHHSTKAEAFLPLGNTITIITAHIQNLADSPRPSLPNPHRLPKAMATGAAILDVYAPMAIAPPAQQGNNKGQSLLTTGA